MTASTHIRRGIAERLGIRRPYAVVTLTLVARVEEPRARTEEGFVDQLRALSPPAPQLTDPSEVCARIRQAAAGTEPALWEVVHACPLPEHDGITPCCGRTLFELPRHHRITLLSGIVTCTGPASWQERR